MQSVEIKAIERDSIGLAVSQVNGCNYCLTVHSFTAEHMAKLPADEIIVARKGHASGYTDANVMEIAALLAMYSPTNFFNNVFDPRRTFPPLRRLAQSELYPVASAMMAWQDQVVVSQTVDLQNERNETDIRRRQMAASVLLIKALGGGWDTSQLPTY